MVSLQDINADSLVLLLQDYFPGLVFIPKKRQPNLSILKYVTNRGGKWILDIAAMSKSGEKIFSSLIPGGASRWDEEQARSKYNRADVIRFFIDAENERFLREFSKLEKAGLADISEKSVPGSFFEKLGIKGKPVWEEWDFSGMVMHKMRHKPPSIYEAFDYYGHRQYTLFGFGLNLVPDTGSERLTGEYLLKLGNRALNDTVLKEIAGISDFTIERLGAFFEILQETLESVPSGGSIYVPTGLDVFIRQLKSRTIDLHKKSSGGDDTYSPADRKTINNQLEKAEGCIPGRENSALFRKAKRPETYREKITLLHRLTADPAVRGQYSRRELDIIHALFLKQQKPLSLDRLLNEADDDGAFTGHDIIGDEKYPDVGDQIAWTSVFKDEFEKELDGDKLERFIECLPGHFARYPFGIDSAGCLKISKYSKKVLFSTFCAAAGIAADEELWKPFLVLIRRVIDNINSGEHAPEGAGYGSR